MPNPTAQSPEAASAGLEAVTNELQEIAALLKSSEVDDHVLGDFRQTIDYVRMTAWARHQVKDERTHRGGLQTVLSLLAADRINRATQLATDIYEDLATAEVSPRTEGLGNLFHALDVLHGRLAGVFKQA